MSFGAGGGYSSNSSTQSLTDILNSIYQTASRQSSTGQSTTSQNGSTLGTTAGTTAGQTQRTLLPQQQDALTSLGGIIKNLSTNPEGFYAPQQNQARNQVDRNYTGLADNLRQQFMGGTNPGASGKFGMAATQGDLARRGALSDVDQNFAVQKAQAPLR